MPKTSNKFLRKPTEQEEQDWQGILSCIFWGGCEDCGNKLEDYGWKNTEESK